jgi:hypothetical protein
MKNLLGALLRAYAAIAAYLVALVAAVVGVLFVTGALSTERLRKSVAVLRTPREKTPERRAVLSDDERREFDKTQRQRQETLDLRERDLQKLESRATGLLAQIRKDQDDLDRNRTKLREDQDQLRKDREVLAAARTDQEIAVNLPILSKMDGAGIVSIMKGWDDPRFVRYLRAMKPAKAAEVLETVRTDPDFETEFRRVPEDAPPGTKTRAERLVEEFKRVP